MKRIQRGRPLQNQNPFFDFVSFERQNIHQTTPQKRKNLVEQRLNKHPTMIEHNDHVNQNFRKSNNPYDTNTTARFSTNVGEDSRKYQIKKHHRTPSKILSVRQLKQTSRKNSSIEKEGRKIFVSLSKERKGGKSKQKFIENDEEIQYQFVNSLLKKKDILKSIQLQKFQHPPSCNRFFC